MSFMEVLAMHFIEQFLDNPFIKRKAKSGSGKGNGGLNGLSFARKSPPEAGFPDDWGLIVSES